MLRIPRITPFFTSSASVVNFVDSTTDFNRWALLRYDSREFDLEISGFVNQAQPYAAAYGNNPTFYWNHGLAR